LGDISTPLKRRGAAYFDFPSDELRPLHDNKSTVT
jgi:hypothetical protein